MIVAETALPGVYTLEIEPHADERGFFARVWDGEVLAAHGLDARVSQSSIAFNRRAGTLRGLHFQRPPHAETKLVRCTRGAVYDVVVDIRPDSDAYLSWLGVKLTEENRRTLYVPEGFAHGYQTLEDETETSYLMSQRYEPSAGRGVRWDDPAFGIEWPDEGDRTMNERDRTWPDFSPDAAGA